MKEETTSIEPSLMPAAEATDAIIKVNELDFFYGTKQALFGINLEIPRQRVTAFIGPSEKQTEDYITGRFG